jgi:hypothetical protein
LAQPSVTTFSTDFSFPKPGFWEFIWIFSVKNHSKLKYFLHSESKSCQINSIKSCSSRSFQQYTKGTFPIPLNFLGRI